MVCWKLGYHNPHAEGGIEHPERWPCHYLEGAAQRGRPAKNRVLTFKTAGLDFNMFDFEDHPPTHEELKAFEAAADVSVFIYDWQTCKHEGETVEFLRMLRAPETLNKHEVQLLNYSVGNESHLMLCTDFQKLASRQRSQHKFFGRDADKDRTCHRCMRRFKTMEGVDCAP